MNLKSKKSEKFLNFDSGVPIDLTWQSLQSGLGMIKKRCAFNNEL